MTSRVSQTAEQTCPTDSSGLADSGRIIQLTDLHLTGTKTRRAWGTDVWPNFERALELVRQLEPFDALVLSGDLANTGRLRAYEFLREALEPWIDRVHVVPGNHDNRRKLRRVFRDLCVDGAGTVNFVANVAGHRLIGLDSKRWFRVHGMVGKRQLAWLRRTLESSALPALLFWHHPPRPVGTWWLDRDVLRDAHELEALLRSHPVRGVFFGHVHQVWSGTFAEACAYGSPSTAYQFRPGSMRPGAVAVRDTALRVIDIADDTLTTRIVTPSTSE
ncbi:MAG: metallophosphoesterase [Planctomycetes bacterium]|nr:metallophosphoesterase [Planctomycetota bacterium]